MDTLESLDGVLDEELIQRTSRERFDEEFQHRAWTESSVGEFNGEFSMRTLRASAKRV